MINVAIQVLTLLNGLLVNLGVPIAYGLHDYGMFLSANILVFLFQRMLSIIAEQFLAGISEQYFLINCLVAAAIVLAMFLGLSVITPAGDWVLLVLFLLNASCMTALFAYRASFSIIFFQLSGICSFVLLLLIHSLGKSSLSITHVLYFSSGIPSILGFFLLLKKGARINFSADVFVNVRAMLKSLPKIFGLTLVFNFFTNIFPFLVSGSIPPSELGLFRVTVSIVQSATSFFPINTRTIFLSFVRDGDGALRYKLLMALSVFYFSGFGLATSIGTELWPTLEGYTLMLPCLPVLFGVVLTERYLIATGKSRRVLGANLLICGLASLYWFLAQGSLREAQICYVVGFSAYLIILILQVSHPGVKFLGMVIAVLSVLLILLSSSMQYAVQIYFVAIAIIALTVFRKHARDLRVLRF